MKRTAFLYTVIALSSLLFVARARADLGAGVPQTYADQYQAGEKSFAAGNYEAAINFFQTALGLEPEQVKPRFRLGQSFLAVGRNQESVESFQNLLERYPNNISARIAMAKGLIAQGKADAAKPQIEWILRVQPEHQEARGLLEVCKSPEPSMDGFEPLPQGFKPIPVKSEKTKESATPERKRNGKTQAEKTSSGNRPEVDPGSPVPPPAAEVDGWRVPDFLALASDSYGVFLEYAKYCMEKDDLGKAADFFDKAERKAAQQKNTRKFLEVQIHRGLLNMYRKDIRAFGEQLMRLKPMLSKNTYASFLEIYNRAQNATTTIAINKLTGGVAMGAEHYPVAARLLSEVLAENPDDLLALRLLAEAQMESRSYDEAEKSLQTLVRKTPKDAEGYINLARFYLTAKFQPGMARQYAEYAANLSPKDERLPVILSLLDYAQGKTKEGVERLSKIRSGVNDPGLQMLCDKIVSEGEGAGSGMKDPKVLAQILALPGTPQASPDSIRKLGESLLKRGSFFSAMKCYLEDRDLAEIGRVYLALASYLFAQGDSNGSALAAGFGLNSVREALRRNPRDAAANLYLALYFFERSDRRSAARYIKAGLQGSPSPDTRRHLTVLMSQVGS